VYADLIPVNFLGAPAAAIFCVRYGPPTPPPAPFLHCGAAAAARCLFKDTRPFAGSGWHERMDEHSLCRHLPGLTLFSITAVRLMTCDWLDYPSRCASLPASLFLLRSPINLASYALHGWHLPALRDVGVEWIESADAALYGQHANAYVRVTLPRVPCGTRWRFALGVLAVASTALCCGHTYSGCRRCGLVNVPTSWPSLPCLYFRCLPASWIIPSP